MQNKKHTPHTHTKHTPHTPRTPHTHTHHSHTHTPHTHTTYTHHTHTHHTPVTLEKFRPTKLSRSDESKTGLPSWFNEYLYVCMYVCMYTLDEANKFILIEFILLEFRHLISTQCTVLKLNDDTS